MLEIFPEEVVPQVAGQEVILPALVKVTASPTLALASPALQLAAALVPWDTESFCVSVAQVQHIEVHDRPAADAEMQHLLTWFDIQGVQLAACRLDHSRLLESSALERIGFRFIEMVYGMEINPQRLQPGADASKDASLGVQWRRACKADLAELQQLAADAFATGRWNMDWSVGQALGGHRYADWVARSLAEPKHEILCAVVECQTIGLFIVEPAGDGSVYWHLTAVEPKWQGRGIGKAMWGSMLHRHAQDGATSVRTTISTRNVPVVNLYARLGWRFVNCQMTYHWASARWLARGG